MTVDHKQSRTELKHSVQQRHQPLQATFTDHSRLQTIMKKLHLQWVEQLYSSQLVYM